MTGNFMTRHAAPPATQWRSASKLTDVGSLAARGIEGKLTVRYTAEHRFRDMAVRVAEGSLRIPAIQTFKFDQIQDAIALQATRHVRGKIAVQVGTAADAPRA